MLLSDSGVASTQRSLAFLVPPAVRIACMRFAWRLVAGGELDDGGKGGGGGGRGGEVEYVLNLGVDKSSGQTLLSSVFIVSPLVIILTGSWSSEKTISQLGIYIHLEYLKYRLEFGKTLTHVLFFISRGKLFLIIKFLIIAGAVLGVNLEILNENPQLSIHYMQDLDKSSSLDQV